MGNKFRSASGFTLVELIVVIAILAIFFAALALPLGRVSGRSSQVVRNSYSSVLFEVQRALRNATFGNGGLALRKDVKNDAKELPEDFGVSFRSSDSVSDESSGFDVFETQTRQQGSVKYTRIVGKERKQLEQSNRTYLRQILVKRDQSDVGTIVTDLSVVFRNPTGNTAFYVNERNFSLEGNSVIAEWNGDTVNEFPEPTPDSSYSIAELYFRDDSGKDTFKIRIHKDKQFYADTYSLTD